MVCIYVYDRVSCIVGGNDVEIPFFESCFYL